VYISWKKRSNINVLIKKFCLKNIKGGIICEKEEKEILKTSLKGRKSHFLTRFQWM